MWSEVRTSALVIGLATTDGEVGDRTDAKDGSMSCSWPGIRGENAPGIHNCSGLSSAFGFFVLVDFTFSGFDAVRAGLLAACSSWVGT